MCYCNREEMQYYKFPSKIITFRLPKARVLRNLSFCKVVLRLIYRLNILYMNVDGGLKPRGISIFSICIFWIEVQFILSNFGRYNENDHCRFFYFLGNRCLVQAGWTVGKWTEWDNVLASIPNHIHMSHDIQLFPIGYPGKFFSVVWYFFSCKYVATYI